MTYDMNKLDFIDNAEPLDDAGANEARKLVMAMINDKSGVLEEAMSDGTYTPRGSTDNINFTNMDPNMNTNSTIPFEGENSVGNARPDAPMGSFRSITGDDNYDKIAELTDKYGDLALNAAAFGGGAAVGSKAAGPVRGFLSKLFGNARNLKTFKPGVNTTTYGRAGVGYNNFPGGNSPLSKNVSTPSIKDYVQSRPYGEMVEKFNLNQNTLSKLTPDQIAKLTQALGGNRTGFTKAGITTKPPGGGAGNYRETTLPVKPSPSQMEAIDAEFMRQEMVKRKLAAKLGSKEGNAKYENLLYNHFGKSATINPPKPKLNIPKDLSDKLSTPYWENKLKELGKKSLEMDAIGSKSGNSLSIKNASRMLPPALIASMLQENDIFLDGDE